MFYGIMDQSAMIRKEEKKGITRQFGLLHPHHWTQYHQR